MKKLLLVIAIITISCNSVAQDTYKYTFKDIPIKGTVAEFSQKLQQQGFKRPVIYGLSLKDLGYDLKQNDLLEGKFLNENVNLKIEGTKDTNEVFLIEIRFSNIEHQLLYFEIRNALWEKYSDPTKFYIDENTDNIINSATVQAIQQGNFRSVCRVFTTECISYCYIGLIWEKEGVKLVYCNAPLCSKIKQENLRKTMSDL